MEFEHLRISLPRHRIKVVILRQKLVRDVTIIFNGGFLCHTSFVLLVLEGRNVDHLVLVHR